MDAGEEPALAPLDLLVGSQPGREAAAQGEPLAFERGERHVDRRAPHAAAQGERGRRGRPHPFEAPAHDLDRRLLFRPDAGGEAARGGDLRRERGLRMEGAELREALGSHPEDRFRSSQDRGAALGGQAVEEPLPAPPPSLFGGDEAQGQQGVVQLVRRRRLGPGLLADARDRRGIEGAEVGGGLRVEPAAQHDRLRAPLFERRAVQEGVGVRGQHLVGERRGLGQVARHQLQLAALHAAEESFEPGDVHRLLQAVGERLLDERMVGDLALADDVFEAGELVGEDDRDQVLRGLAQKRRRHPPAGPPARQGEGAARVPAPAHAEERGVEHRLGEHVAHRVGVQEAEGVCEREAVRRPEREDDRVLGRRRLQLEVEGLAEALAESQSPGAVQPAAERRVDDHVHVAGLVEEALGDQGLAGRHGAERGEGDGEIVGDLRCRGRRQAEVAGEPGDRRLSPPLTQAVGDRPAQAPRRARRGSTADARGRPRPARGRARP